MESSYQTRRLIGRVLALLLVGGLAAAFWAHYRSPLVQILAKRSETPIRIVLLTEPAMRFSYNPVTRKTVITLAPCNKDNLKTCFNAEYDRFFQPVQTDQQDYWSQFKDSLSSWRFNPAPLWTYVHSYINAFVQKRTDISPAEFILLSLELPELTATDFAIEQPTGKKKKTDTSKQKDAITPLELAVNKLGAKPLKVVVLNASGKRGLAESLKQYLRAQHAKGLLQVDVYDTGNYPTLQDTSFIIDHSGKLVQVTQVSRAIGITTEIRSDKSASDIYDCHIVLGKDFKMPL